jgi:glycerophosphoryl diester phosphodiesterase
MRTGGYPLYMAHRGGGGALGPENTLHTSLLSAQQWPRIRALEIDIRLTRDRHLVLMHDSSVDRTTDGQGAVNQMLLSEIKALDAAHCYPHLAHVEIRVPTLIEFLDEFLVHRKNEWPDLMFMFDFKDEESIERTWVLLKHYQDRGLLSRGRYMVGSVFEAPNNLLQRLLSEMGGGGDGKIPPLMTDITQTTRLAIAHGTGMWSFYEFGGHDVFGYVLQSQTPLFLTAGLIDALHDKGMRVLVCGPRLAEPDLHQHCLDCGVDYIMIDALLRVSDDDDDLQ